MNQILRKNTFLFKMTKRYSSNFNEFQTALKEAKNIVVLTGAGISAESGIPVFRGAGGFWRTHRATDLATPQAFKANPSLVWEFYHYRREVAFNAEPNKAHLALAKFEEICRENSKNFAIITQNVDGLHRKAGSKEIIELHGSLDKVICTKCKSIEVNANNPICEALKGRGDPANSEDCEPIARKDLPKCSKCQSLVRPYIVWFGENLDSAVLDKSKRLIETCDLCLVVGTSSVVYPAAMFAPTVLERGKPVAEFNINDEPFTDDYTFYFPGKCGSTLPRALGTE